jgi:hypothetical protein
MRRFVFAVALMLILPPPLAAQIDSDRPIARAATAAFQYPAGRPLPDAELQRLQAERAAKQRAERDALNTATWTYVATAGADWAVYAVCVEVTCTDSGKTQTGQFLHGVKPAAAVPIGLAIDVGIVLAIREWLAPEHPKLAQFLLYGLSGARVIVLTDRIRDLRGHAVRQPR